LKMFAGMGISEVALKGKDATQVMGLLAEKMQGMSGGKAMALGEKLGMDEGTVRLLQKGKASLDALTGAIKKNVASAEQVAAATAFHEKMLALQGAMAATGRQILTAVMPALTAMSEGLAKVGAWIRDHGTMVKAALIGVAAALSLVGANALIMGVQAAWAWVLLLGPLDFIIAGLAIVGAGIAWVYLEFQKWADGGESVLSGFFQFFKDIWDAIKGTVLTVFYTMKDIVMTFFQVFEDYWNLVVGLFTGNGDKIKASFKALCKDIGHFFSEAALLLVYELLRAFFVIEHAGAKMWKAMKKGAEEALNWIGDKLAKIGNVVLKVATLGMGGGGQQPAFAGVGASAGMAMRPSTSNSNSTSTSTRETHIGAIHIETKATDAKGIAAELPGAIKSHGLSDQSDGGV